MTENLSTGLLSNFITAAFGENLRFTISFLFAFAFLMLLFLRVSEKQRRKHARETLQEAVEANDGFRGFEVTVQETDTNEDHYFLRGTVSSVSFPNAKAPELHLSEVYRFEVTSL